MEKVLFFNWLNKDLEFREGESNFKVVSEYWIQTSVGPLMPAEVWKDTETNRAIIKEIIDRKLEIKAAEDMGIKHIYRLANKKEK